MHFAKLAIFALLCGVAMGHMGMSAQGDDYVGLDRVESGSGSGSGSGLDKLDTGVPVVGSKKGKKGPKSASASVSVLSVSAKSAKSRSKSSKGSGSGLSATATSSQVQNAGMVVGAAVLVAGVVAVVHRRNRMQSGYSVTAPDATERTPLVETPAVVV